MKEKVLAQDPQNQVLRPSFQHEGYLVVSEGHRVGIRR